MYIYTYFEGTHWTCLQILILWLLVRFVWRPLSCRYTLELSLGYSLDLA